MVAVRLLGLPAGAWMIGDVQLPTSGSRSVARPTWRSGRRVEPVPGWVAEWCLGVAQSRARRAGLGVGDGFGDGVGDGVELEVGNGVELGVGDVSGSGSSSESGSGLATVTATVLASRAGLESETGSGSV